VPFKSKAQQGLFFTDPRLKKYAHKWAHETGMGGKHSKQASKKAYARLPTRVRKKKRKRRHTG
jgi:hypothetical protein